MWWHADTRRAGNRRMESVVSNIHTIAERGFCTSVTCTASWCAHPGCQQPMEQAHFADIPGVVMLPKNKKWFLPCVMTLQSGVPSVLQDFVALTLQVFKVHEESYSALDFSHCYVKVTLSWKFLDHLLSDAASRWNLAWIIQNDPREPDIFKINSTQLFFK